VRNDARMLGRERWPSYEEAGWIERPSTAGFVSLLESRMKHFCDLRQ
jgi:hypothetical protein